MKCRERNLLSFPEIKCLSEIRTIPGSQVRSSSPDISVSGTNDTYNFCGTRNKRWHFSPSNNGGIKLILSGSLRIQFTEFPLTTSTQPQHDIMILFKREEYNINCRN